MGLKQFGCQRGLGRGRGHGHGHGGVSGINFVLQIFPNCTIFSQKSFSFWGGGGWGYPHQGVWWDPFFVANY